MKRLLVGIGLLVAVGVGLALALSAEGRGGAPLGHAVKDDALLLVSPTSDGVRITRVEFSMREYPVADVALAGPVRLLDPAHEPRALVLVGRDEVVTVDTTFGNVARAPKRREWQQSFDAWMDRTILFGHGEAQIVNTNTDGEASPTMLLGPTFVHTGHHGVTEGAVLGQDGSFRRLPNQAPDGGLCVANDALFMPVAGGDEGPLRFEVLRPVSLEGEAQELVVPHGSLPSRARLSGRSSPLCGVVRHGYSPLTLIGGAVTDGASEREVVWALELDSPELEAPRPLWMLSLERRLLPLRSSFRSGREAFGRHLAVVSSGNDRSCRLDLLDLERGELRYYLPLGACPTRLMSTSTDEVQVIWMGFDRDQAGARSAPELPAGLLVTLTTAKGEARFFDVAAPVDDSHLGRSTLWLLTPEPTPYGLPDLETRPGAPSLARLTDFEGRLVPGPHGETVRFAEDR